MTTEYLNKQFPISQVNHDRLESSCQQLNVSRKDLVNALIEFGLSSSENHTALLNLVMVQKYGVNLNNQGN